MQRAGVIGLGDMGSGLAKNLIAHGFETTGFDLSAARMSAFVALGGRPAASPAEVGARADAAFVDAPVSGGFAGAQGGTPGSRPSCRRRDAWSCRPGTAASRSRR